MVCLNIFLNKLFKKCQRIFELCHFYLGCQLGSLVPVTTGRILFLVNQDPF